MFAKASKVVLTLCRPLCHSAQEQYLVKCDEKNCFPTALTTADLTLPTVHSMHSAPKLYMSHSAPHSNYTPHFALRILHSTLPTLHYTPYTFDTPCSTLCTRHSALFTPHPHTPHSTIYIHSITLHISPHCKSRTLHSRLYTSHSTFDTLHPTIYTSHLPLYIPHSPLLTFHAPHFTLRTLHSTVYTLHIKFYTAHSALHKKCTAAQHSTLHCLNSTLDPALPDSRLQCLQWYGNRGKPFFASQSCVLPDVQEGLVGWINSFWWLGTFSAHLPLVMVPVPRGPGVT